MYEGTVTPTIVYGCEAWTLCAKTRKRIDVLDMIYPPTIAAVHGLPEKEVKGRDKCVETFSVWWKKRMKRCLNGLVMLKEWKDVMVKQLVGKRE